MQKTKIGWTECTWNPVTGCTPVSAGCQHCYARRMAQRLRGRFGYPADDPFRVTLHPDRLDEPLRLRKPRMIFVCSMGDLFHEDVPDEFIDKVFAVVFLCPQHTFQLLTKRLDRAVAYLTHQNTPGRIQTMAFLENFLNDHAGESRDQIAQWYLAHPLDWPLSNLWLGATVENADHLNRLDHLLQTPAAVRLVSLEPMLAGIDLDGHLPAPTGKFRTHEGRRQFQMRQGLDWVIVGGETGPGARPMNPDWVRSVRDQCEAVGVPFFFKSWGEWYPAEYATDEQLDAVPTVYWAKPLNPAIHENVAMFRTRYTPAGCKYLLDGRTHDDMPERAKE